MKYISQGLNPVDLTATLKLVKCILIFNGNWTRKVPVIIQVILEQLGQDCSQCHNAPLSSLICNFSTGLVLITQVVLLERGP